MVIAGGFRRYSKMLVQKNNVTSTLFLSTLFPYTTIPPVVGQAGQSSSSASVRIQAENFRDLVICSQNGVLANVSSDSSGMNKPVKGNGKVNFFSETTDGLFSSAFLHAGDSIVAGPQAIIITGKKMDVAWMKIDADLSGGYVSDFGTVKFYADKPLQILQGAATYIEYDAVHHLAVITLSSKGNFMAGPADLTWVWTGKEDNLWQNPANWQMQDHAFISGVPVATNNVIIPSGALHMPVVSSANPATCHDLTILAGASLTVGSLKFLTVEGTLTLEDDHAPQ
jgi:hypothetical protein